MSLTGPKLQLISITNYTGEGREYLKKLAVAMGGNFSLSFDVRNSHLVSAV